MDEPPPDLEGQEGIHRGVLYLLQGEVALIPAAHRHPSGLTHLHPEHLLGESSEPLLAHLRPAHSLSGEAAEIGGVDDGDAVIVGEAFDIVVDTDADEGEAAVGEKVEEGSGEVVGVEEEEDEAAAADAKLEDGHPVLGPGEAGAPLDVEADDEAVEAALVDVEDIGEPRLYLVAGGRRRRHDIVGAVEGDDVVGIVFRMDARRHLDS